MEPIPFADLGADTAPALLTQYPHKARALIDASRDAFGFASRLASAVALPVGDYFSKRWLHKTNNPYTSEIDAMARTLGGYGVHALNLCYEWGCTSGAWATDGITLTRVLDWPFPALGKHMVVARQQCAAGEYHNITWPGVAGVYQAIAKGRFAATLNQAPMRRHGTDIITDWVRNRIRLWNTNALPPSHLLRHVFETATDYANAKHLLVTTPLALPVIYVLGGTKEGEGCVIERLENEAVIREIGSGISINAANHFESYLNGIGKGWMPRATASNARCVHAASFDLTHIDTNFSWFTAPIANPLSRMALTMNASTGNITLMGTEGTVQATDIFQHTVAA